jgi:hypothetical protein
MKFFCIYYPKPRDLRMATILARGMLRWPRGQAGQNA